MPDHMTLGYKSSEMCRRVLHMLARLSIVFISLNYSTCMLPSAPLSGTAKSVQSHDITNELSQLEKNMKDNLVDHPLPNVPLQKQTLEHRDRKVLNSEAEAFRPTRQAGPANGFKPTQAPPTHGFYPVQASSTYAFQPVQAQHSHLSQPVQAPRSHGFQQVQATPTHVFQPVQTPPNVPLENVTDNMPIVSELPLEQTFIEGYQVMPSELAHGRLSPLGLSNKFQVIETIESTVHPVQQNVLVPVLGYFLQPVETCATRSVVTRNYIPLPEYDEYPQKIMAIPQMRDIKHRQDSEYRRDTLDSELTKQHDMNQQQNPAPQQIQNFQQRNTSPQKNTSQQRKQFQKPEKYQSKQQSLKQEVKVTQIEALTMPIEKFSQVEKSKQCFIGKAEGQRINSKNCGNRLNDSEVDLEKPHLEPMVSYDLTIEHGKEIFPGETPRFFEGKSEGRMKDVVKLNEKCITKPSGDEEKFNNEVEENKPKQYEVLDKNSKCDLNYKTKPMGISKNGVLNQLEERCEKFKSPGFVKNYKIKNNISEFQKIYDPRTMKKVDVPLTQERSKNAQDPKFLTDNDSNLKGNYVSSEKETIIHPKYVSLKTLEYIHKQKLQKEKNEIILMNKKQNPPIPAQDVQKNHLNDSQSPNQSKIKSISNSYEEFIEKNECKESRNSSQMDFCHKPMNNQAEPHYQRLGNAHEIENELDNPAQRKSFQRIHDSKHIDLSSSKELISQVKTTGEGSIDIGIEEITKFNQFSERNSRKSSGNNPNYSSLGQSKPSLKPYKLKEMEGGILTQKEGKEPDRGKTEIRAKLPLEMNTIKSKIDEEIAKFDEFKDGKTHKTDKNNNLQIQEQKKKTKVLGEFTKSQVEIDETILNNPQKTIPPSEDFARIGGGLAFSQNQGFVEASKASNNKDFKNEKIEEEGSSVPFFKASLRKKSKESQLKRKTKPNLKPKNTGKSISPYDELNTLEPKLQENIESSSFEESNTLKTNQSTHSCEYLCDEESIQKSGGKNETPPLIPHIYHPLENQFSLCFAPWNGGEYDSDELMNYLGKPFIDKQISLELDHENNSRYREPKLISNKGNSVFEVAQGFVVLLRKLLKSDKIDDYVPIQMMKRQEYQILCKGWYNYKDEFLNELSVIRYALGENEGNRRFHAFFKQIISLTIAENWKSFTKKVLKSNKISEKELKEIESYFLPSLPFPDLTISFPDDISSESKKSSTRKMYEKLDFKYTKDKFVSTLGCLMGSREVMDRFNLRGVVLIRGTDSYRWWEPTVLRKLEFENGVDVSHFITIGDHLQFWSPLFWTGNNMEELDSAVGVLDKTWRFNKERKIQWIDSPEFNWFTRNSKELYHSRMKRILSSIKELENSQTFINIRNSGLKHMNRILERIEKEYPFSELFLSLQDYFRLQALSIDPELILRCKKKIISLNSFESFGWERLSDEFSSLSSVQIQCLKGWLKNQDFFSN